MAHKYLFIAHKPDSSDYCRGCLMASYSSDFELRNYIDEVELVKVWSEYLVKNMNLDCNEKGYGFWIFCDGVMLHEEHFVTSDRVNSYWQYEEYDTSDLVEKEIEEKKRMCVIKDKATQLAKERDKQIKDTVKEELKKKLAAADEAEKERKKRMYEQLKKEFQ